MTQERTAPTKTLENDLPTPGTEGEFDQWARAVRQQMVAALKRRGNH
jgi:hypothetical protein